MNDKIFSSQHIQQEETATDTVKEKEKLSSIELEPSKIYGTSKPFRVVIKAKIIHD